MSDNQQPRTMGLVDVVRPLVRYWRIPAIGLFLLVVACLVLFLFFKQPQVAVMELSFKVYPLMYSEYTEIASRLDDKVALDKFFTQDNLGVDPATFFVSQMGSSSLIKNNYFLVDYPRLDDKPSSPDPFKGVYSSDGKLVQGEQDTFYIRIASGVSDQKKMESIAQRIVEDYIASTILEYSVDHYLVDRMLFFSQKTNNSDNLRTLRALKEDEALLVKFQREFPSMIRLSMTLNESSVPVEVQLIEKRKAISGVERDIADYYVSLPMVKAFSVLIEKQRALDMFSSFNLVERQDYCGRLTALVKDVFDPKAYALDPSANGESLRVKMGEEGDSLKASFSLLFDETRVPLSVLHPKSQIQIEGSSSKWLLYFLVVFVLILCIPYVIYVSKDIYNKLYKEKVKSYKEKD